MPLQGFCLPKELLEDEAGEGATEFHDYEDGGIGEGEGKKDVSDKIESEDQASIWGHSCLIEVKLEKLLKSMMWMSWVKETRSYLQSPIYFGFYLCISAYKYCCDT